MNIFILIGVFFQLTFPTPIFPVLESPTPFQTPTPQPTLQIQADDFLATATAQANAVNLDANGNQVYYNNAPLLPNLSSSSTTTTIGYTKWLVSTGTASVFGPFTPILVSLALLLTINLVFLLVYIWQKYIVTLIRAAWWVISLVIRIIRG